MISLFRISNLNNKRTKLINKNIKYLLINYLLNNLISFIINLYY
jgi:hypothetical protein